MLCRAVKINEAVIRCWDRMCFGRRTVRWLWDSRNHCWCVVLLKICGGTCPHSTVSLCLKFSSTILMHLHFASSEQVNQIYLMLCYELTQLHSCFTCSPLASVIGPTIFTARTWEAASASTSVSAASPHPRSPWDLSTNPGPVWPPAIRAPAASKGGVD